MSHTAPQQASYAMPNSMPSPSTSAPSKHVVKDLQAALAKRMSLVNQSIVDEMHSSVPMIPQLGQYLIAAGGKRIRPLMTLAAAAIGGYDTDAHTGNGIPHDVLLAAVIEFIHTATLLHDDVVDESSLRRGQPSANIVFGNQASVLVGDFLFSRAFQLMVRVGDLQILHALSSASATIAEGEVLQLSALGDTDMTEETYNKVISAKTAALFAAATEVGARLSPHFSHQEIQALRAYGHGLGMAFQIADDCLDYRADEDSLGKHVGDDFREGKMTLPVILTLRKATRDERDQWHRWFNPTEPPTETEHADQFAQAVTMMDRYDALAHCQAQADIYVAQAQQALTLLPDHPMCTILHDLVAFAAHRTS